MGIKIREKNTPHIIAYAAGQVGQGTRGHDPPIKLTVACAAGHFVPTRSATMTKRKVVQTPAQCPPPVLIKQFYKLSYNSIFN